MDGNSTGVDASTHTSQMRMQKYQGGLTVARLRIADAYYMVVIMRVCACLGMDRRICGRSVEFFQCVCMWRMVVLVVSSSYQSAPSDVSVCVRVCMCAFVGLCGCMGGCI